MMELLLSTFICTDCGEEIESGIRNAVAHDKVCKRDAPNENIESHKISQHWNSMDIKEKEDFDPIFNKMLPEEQLYLVLLSLRGIFDPHSNCVMMGAESFTILKNYREKMKNKYSK